ncbi:unnamed protein product [Rhodiola kirilowii]
MFHVMAHKFLIFYFLILITLHQLVPLAMAAPGTGISRVIIAGGSYSGLGGGGGKKPRKVMQSRGFEGWKMSQFGVGGSSSPHGGGGNPHG